MLRPKTKNSPWAKHLACSLIARHGKRSTTINALLMILWCVSSRSVAGSLDPALQRRTRGAWLRRLRRFSVHRSRARRLRRGLPDLACACLSPTISRIIIFVMLYDAFICHASEDKDAFVRPLAEALQQNHLEIWYDEFTLSIGDSIRRAID